MIRLHNDDFANALRYLPPSRMIFADPPDNIGLKYTGYKDKVTPGDYQDFITKLLYMSVNATQVIWLSINARHTFMVGGVIHSLLERNEDWEAKPCVQTFTFGQHNSRDLGNNHRPLIRLKRRDVVLYPNAVRVPSWRQLNGDKRADPRGRVPGDVFDFPRVTGNSKQRRKFSPTQLHEGLYERCIRLCCKPGDTVVDLFAGSGTLGRVAPRCGVNGIMVELSTDVCKNIALDLGVEL